MSTYPMNPLAAPLQFQTMPREELRAYFSQYVSSVPRRVELLASAVREQWPKWSPTLTRESLLILESWLVERIETRLKTPQERAVDAIADAGRGFDYPEKTLTDSTLSCAMDVGMYFGSALRQRCPHLYWDLQLGSQRWVEYGQPVLAGFPKKVVLNPTRISNTIAYEVVYGTFKAGGLLQAFDRWVGHATATSAVTPKKRGTE